MGSQRCLELTIIIEISHVVVVCSTVLNRNISHFGTVNSGMEFHGYSSHQLVTEGS